MIIQIPWKIELPDSIYIGNEQLPAEVHTTPYGGLADVVIYESENGRDHIDVKLEEQSVYVRYNGQSDTKYFERIEDLVEYLMRSCNLNKSAKKSQLSTKSFNDMVKKQRMKKDYLWDKPQEERTMSELADFELYCGNLSHIAESLEARIKATYTAHDEGSLWVRPLLRDAQDEVAEMKRYVSELEKIVENLVMTMEM